jgi:nucleoside recognition membrane protein YjiH
MLWPGMTITINKMLRFLLPSTLGWLLFLVPISYGDKTSIGLGIIIDWIRLPLRGYELELVVAIVLASAIGSGYCLIFKPDWGARHPTLHGMCQVKFPWFLWRAISALMGMMILFGVGPEVLLAEDTGPLLYPLIGAVVITTLFVAYMLMPLLTEFGLLEFMGTLIRRPFEFLFTLPGRAAIDAASSIVSASSVGVVLTISQYESGCYSRREAISVATNFSIVSLPFSLVVAETAGISHMFFSWYLSVVAVCLVCAAIMVRIPPLVCIGEDYYGPVGMQVHEEKPVHISAFQWGLQQATAKAAHADPPLVILRTAWNHYWVTIFNVVGPGVVISVFSGILAFHTPVLDVLAWPIRQVLEAFSLPEAASVAPGFIVGFLDQFTPAVLATRVESEQMRFVLAGLSLAQLIYLADMGVLLLRSPLGVRLRDLALIFCMRTLIVAPLLIGVSFLLL